MILTVAHRTAYRYDAPIRMAVQSLRLTPSEFAGQRLIDWQVAVEGGQKGAGFRDGAGDWIESWSLRGPADRVTVTVVGTVETADLAGLLTGHREAVNPAVYLRETQATRADGQLAELARAAAVETGEPLARAHALSRLVAEAIAYRPGATEAHTTAAEAMALGEGVCQDHAHALIAAARVLGLPARYASGYLFATEDGAAHEAAHAWAEVWIEGLGWIGFDPANRSCPDDRYVRLGSGLDARDAAPIRGIAQGAGRETLDVTVAVGQGQQ
ncbi:transglutaminase family protein [Albidovulum sp.]|jgi:transglutaminase-like putative cysteine protease|uniref:transglutaminase family protein n=3 Tax=Albidovulum sp. TaxID=1872424 RepID=UPI00304CBB28